MSATNFHAGQAPAAGKTGGRLAFDALAEWLGELSAWQQRNSEDALDVAPALSALFDSLRAQVEQLRQREVTQLQALKPWFESPEQAYIGPTLEVQRAWLHGAQAGLAQVGVLGELRVAYLGVLTAAFERAAEAFKDETGPPLKSAREIFDTWVKIADRAWLEYAKSDSHARQLAALAASALKARRAMREGARAGARAFGIPFPWSTVRDGFPPPAKTRHEKATQEVVMKSATSPKIKPAKRKPTVGDPPAKTATKKKSVLRKASSTKTRAARSEFDIGHIGRAPGNKG